jgi:CHASE2 domain-containing sensor protein
MTGAVHTEGAAAGSKWPIVVLGMVWAAALAVALVGLSRAGALPEGPDEWSYDWRTLLFSPTAKTPSKEIAVLLIDEETLADYDYLSPVDRGFMATLLQAVDAASPRAIGVDFIFERRSEEGKTQKLIDTIRTVKAPIVFGAIDLRIRSLKDEIKYQEDFIARTGREAGHVFFARDITKFKIADQTVRYMGERAPAPPDRKSFAQLLAEKSGRTIAEPATPYIFWMLPPPGDDLFPTFRVPRHAPGSGPDTVLPPSWRNALKGRIVLIGGGFPDRDRHLTPLSIWDGEKMPGVMIQAQILSQLLDGRSIRALGWPLELMLLMVVALIGFLISQSLGGKRYDLVFYVIGLGALLAIGILFFWQASVIAPSTTLFFAWTLGITGGHYAHGVLQRLQLAG